MPLTCQENTNVGTEFQAVVKGGGDFVNPVDGGYSALASPAKRDGALQRRTCTSGSSTTGASHAGAGGL